MNLILLYQLGLEHEWAERKCTGDPAWTARREEARNRLTLIFRLKQYNLGVDASNAGQLTEAQNTEKLS